MLLAVVFLGAFVAAAFGFLSLDLEVVNDQLDARSDVWAPILNQGYYFTAEIEVGSHHDKVRVQVDTGSSDLWVQTAQNPLCGSVCRSRGVFDESKSSTFHSNGTFFHNSYADGSFVNGTWSQDSVSIGDVTVKGANFAVAELSNSNTSILGIGFDLLESTVSPKVKGKLYDNFPIQLKKQGFIDKVAYSLYLGPAGTTYGNVLFGGIDTEKYDGKLTSLPITEIDNKTALLTVTLESLNVTVTKVGKTNSSTIAAPTATDQFWSIPISAAVLIDSGNSDIYIPLPGAEVVLQQVAPHGAPFDDFYEAYLVSCSIYNKENYVSFFFSNSSEIRVPFTDALGYDPKNATTGLPVCYLAIYDGGTLGVPFLRNSYTVFDLEDKTISLAPVRHTNDSNIVPIK